MDIAVIAAVVAALGSAAAWCTLLIARGRSEAKSEESAESAARKAAEAHSTSLAAVAKAELISAQLSEFKLEVAEKYVSSKAADAIEGRITSEVHQLSEDVKSSMTEINRRFDTLTKTLIETLASTPAGLKRKT